jgi:hypothetical protein
MTYHLNKGAAALSSEQTPGVDDKAWGTASGSAWVLNVVKRVGSTAVHAQVVRNEMRRQQRRLQTRGARERREL